MADDDIPFDGIKPSAFVDYALSHLFHLTVTQPSAKHHALARSWLNAKRVGAFLQLFT